MDARLLTFFSSEFSGGIIAFAVLLLAAALFFLARFMSQAVYAVGLKGVSGLILALALLLGAGAFYQAYKIRQADILYPPPGQLVDVGGYQMHILAEGPQAEGSQKNDATIVWISGAHEQGLVLHHLHKAVRGGRRTILFDRPGTGWSDVGPFPRTVEKEAQELHRLLKNTGEAGPFILAPWSFGGLLAITFADLFPEDTAGLLLMDTTYSLLPVFDRETNIRAMCDRNRMAAWRARFGLEWDPAAQLTEQQLVYYQNLYAPIADVQEAVLANNARPAYFLSACSALGNSAIRVFGSTLGRGVLGDLPIFVMIPDDHERQAEVFAMTYFKTELEQKNARRFSLQLKSDMAELSSRSRIMVAPEGTTHSFPFEAPDFVLGALTAMDSILAHKNYTAEN